MPRQAAPAIMIALLALSATPAVANKISATTPFFALGSEKPPAHQNLPKNGIIASTKAVYALLSEPDTDIYGIDGSASNTPKLLAEKNDQLFGVVSDNGQATYCRIDNKSVGSLNGIFVNNRDKHTCFIDGNNDGFFEASYDLRTEWIFGGPPSYFDVETIGNPLISPVSYKRIDPLLCKLDFRLEAYVSRIYSGGTKADVNFRLVTADSRNLLGDEYRIAFPNTKYVKHYGATFLVSAHDEKTVSITYGSGFTRGRFVTTKPKFLY